MSISATSSASTSRDDLLTKLIEEALGRFEIEAGLNNIRLSKGELRREAKARLGAHKVNIWASAESERQEVQRIESEVGPRAAAIDAENQINRKGFWRRNWKTYAILGVCATIPLILSGVHIFTYHPLIRIELIATGSLFLVILGGWIFRERLRLERDRLKQHQELKNEQDAAWRSYVAALLDRGVLPFIREVMNDPNIQKEYYGVRFSVGSAPGLQGGDAAFIIETGGSTQLRRKLKAMSSGGSFGIAGPRGSLFTTRRPCWSCSPIASMKLKSAALRAMTTGLRSDWQLLGRHSRQAPCWHGRGYQAFARHGR